MAKKRGRPRKNPEDTVETKPKTETQFEKTIGKHRAKDGTVRATVMTEAASQVGDLSRSKSRPGSKYFNSDCIHRPKD